MEAQQLATKVTQLESRVATLEDEGKIIRGEVKQVLTEIRTAVLARDNPFDSESVHARPTPITITPAPAAEITVHAAPAVEAPKPKPAAAPAEQPAAQSPNEDHTPLTSKEPVMLRPGHEPAPLPAPELPQWSLLTIAGLAAWAEEAMTRLGPLRLEILLDLCEAAGHLTPEARVALARITELDVPEPTRPQSSNETVVILRQLDALVNDEQDYGPPRSQARF